MKPHPYHHITRQAQADRSHKDITSKFAELIMGTFFSFAREEGFPTQFGEWKTPTTVDVLEAGVILAFVFLGCTSYMVVLGARGKAQLYLFIRITLSLFIGVLLMVGNFGQEWEVGHITANTPYKAGTADEINAAIGMKLGLRSVNITLKRTGINIPCLFSLLFCECARVRGKLKYLALVSEVERNNSLSNEKIDYNERFTWTWDQGRFGFGPYAGRLQREFREAQIRGLPLPILWVADYFTWDGEGIRFGRYYRTAGWYAHICMWTAFACWILANMLFLSVLRYGGYFTVLTGTLQLLACVLWLVIRNPLPLSIPFGDEELKTIFGNSFWLTVVSGSLSLILGVIIIFLDLRYPDEIAIFFGEDPLADYEEYHLTPSEFDVQQNKQKNKHLDVEMDVMNTQPEGSVTQLVLKRRTTVRQVQKGLFRTPVSQPRFTEEQPLYLNVPQPGYSASCVSEERLLKQM